MPCVSYALYVTIEKINIFLFYDRSDISILENKGNNHDFSKKTLLTDLMNRIEEDFQMMDDILADIRVSLTCSASENSFCEIGK